VGLRDAAKPLVHSWFRRNQLATLGTAARSRMKFDESLIEWYSW
jgi:hypothetical protein